MRKSRVNETKSKIKKGLTSFLPFGNYTNNVMEALFNHFFFIPILLSQEIVRSVERIVDMFFLDFSTNKMLLFM